MYTFQGDSATWFKVNIPLAGYNLSDTTQFMFHVDKTGSGYFYNDILIDDVKVETPPTCPAVGPITFSNLTATGSQADWDTTASPQTYQIEYGQAGFAPGTGTSVIATTNTYTFTGLPANNLAYEMYIRPICSGNDTGMWAGPTMIAKSAVPCDDFEVYPLGPISGVSNLVLPWAGDGGDAEVVSFGGSQALHLYDSGTNGFGDVVAVFDSITSGTHVVGFDFQLGSGTNDGGYYNILHEYTGGVNTWAIEVYMDNNGTATVNQGTNGTGVIGTYTFNTTGWNRLDHVIDLDNDTAYIVVNGTPTSVGWQFSLGSSNNANRFNAVNFYSAANVGQTPNYYIDNFCVCSVPSMISSPNATCTTVELDWMSSGSAIIQYGPAGFTPGSGTFVSGVTSPYTVTGLTAGTAYDFWIGEDCNGDTLYNAPLSVSTVNGPKPLLNISHSQDTATLTSADYILYSGTTNADSVHWDFGGGITMNGDTVMNTYGSNGSVSVTVFASNDCGDTTVTYTFDVEDISVAESALGRSLTVFPNPSTGAVTLSFNLNTDEEVDVFILNGLGQRVMEEHIGQVNSFEGQFDLSDLPKGVYIMQVQAGDIIVNRRVTLH